MKTLIIFISALFTVVVYAADAPVLSVQEQYSALIEANKQEKWDQVIKNAQEILDHYAESPFAKEALFYLAVGHFNQEDYEWANRFFSDYLKNQAIPKHFEEAIQYKFEIAQKFKQGAKKHLFGVKTLPQWAPAKADALSIYEEVIAALPHHDLAAQALYAKGELLADEEDFRASLDAYQTLIRRFPKHPLAAESYIGIIQVYFLQAQAEYPDPDFLDLAEINLRKFRNSFPREEKISVAQNIFAKMQEHYAQGLYETGRFFERSGKYSAAVIYYSKILTNFPHTRTASLCKERLEMAKAKLAAQEEK